jgi:hypothetical protein
MEYQVYTRRRSTDTRRSELERQEMEAVGGQQQLREVIVYSSVMALPAPTAPPRPGMSVMHELPRRVHGMHPRLAALENIQRGSYTYHSEYVLPSMVPDSMVPQIKAASALCKIKKGIEYLIKKVKGKRSAKRARQDLDALVVVDSD